MWHSTQDGTNALKCIDQGLRRDVWVIDKYGIISVIWCHTNIIFKKRKKGEDSGQMPEELLNPEVDRMRRASQGY